jgi:hypothetical protein
MAWHLGIRIVSVTMAPPDDNAHAGLTETVPDEVLGLAQAEARMRVAAAGEIAQEWRLQYWRPVPEELLDDSLRGRFAHDERVVAESDFLRFDDRLIFAWWGRKRDEVIGDIAPDEARGPTSWLPAFRDAELLIRGDLWPAVAAVAEELSWSTSDLSHEDVTRLAAAALNRAEE